MSRPKLGVLWQLQVPPTCSFKGPTCSSKVLHMLGINLQGGNAKGPFISAWQGPIPSKNFSSPKTPGDNSRSAPPEPWRKSEAFQTLEGKLRPWVRCSGSFKLPYPTPLQSPGVWQ